MTVISKTPLRVSFVGGGTDIQTFYGLYGGAVLSTAIDKFIYIILIKRDDMKIGLYYDETELVSDPGEVRHELIRETLKVTGAGRGLNIIVKSDVPTQGTGLGSSSSMTVGLLTALYAYENKDVDMEYIARQACRIEIDILGSPIGKQDQYAAAFGGMNVFRFLPDETVIREPVTMPEILRQEFFSRLFMVNTGMSRSAGDVLREVRNNMPVNMDYLKEMARMPDIFRSAIQNGDFESAALCLRTAWDLKKKVGSSVTNTAIDNIYNDGLKAGAAAGKLLGAGAGGFILFMVPPEQKSRFLAEMSEKYETVPMNYCERGSSIMYCFRQD